MELFADQHRAAVEAAAPLAVRMRPRTLDEFVGQRHVLGEGGLLRRLLQADRLGSIILYGPAGTGKTTLAHLIARHTSSEFEALNAAAAGVKEVRAVLECARTTLETTGRRTILFVDELHRFNKGQQDVLLGDVENGIVAFLGATTENPFFTVNAPLVSRSHVFQFESLTVADIVAVLERALSDPQRGLGQHAVQADDDALVHIATKCEGDARKALAALEIAVLSRCDADQPIRVDLAVAEASIQRKALAYEARGDGHYDVASALIKSMRGSDPDAAVYWLARMVTAGEDPRFIARRIAICAAEDIGNADPMALVLANAAAQLTHQVGLPECELILAQAVIYLACAPKSNRSAQAIWKAKADLAENRTQPVPRHLRGSGPGSSDAPGGGSRYRNPHDAPAGHVDQEYLGVDRQYYEPGDRGHEALMASYLAAVRGASVGDGNGVSAPVEPS